MMYSCKRCGYESTRKGNMRHHLSRKMICEPLLEDISIETLKLELEDCEHQSKKENKEYVCEICGVNYQSRQGLLKHEKKFHNESTKIKELENLVKDLQEQLAKEKEKTANTQIINKHNGHNIDHQENHYHVNIIINPYGTETTSHLTPEFLTNCMFQCNDGMKNLIQQIYFNPGIPENHNVRYKSKKQNLLETMGMNQRWIECDQSTTLDDMISKGHKVLCKHFIDSINEKEVKERQECVQMWLAQMASKTGKKYFDLKRDLFWMIKDNTVYLFE